MKCKQCSQKYFDDSNKLFLCSECRWERMGEGGKW